MTIVINLFGGSGLGKSTTAAALFSEMKMKGYHVELVTEFVKNWAWQGRVPTGYDQVYLFGKQAQSESRLYHKVDYIVTDSPLLLSGFYEQYHLKREIIFPAIVNFLKYASDNNISHVNFLLTRNKSFDPRGRFENEEQAKTVDIELKNWLDKFCFEYQVVSCDDRERVDIILNKLKLT